MLTNPIFYKIEKVGKAKRKATTQGKQIKASRAIIEARLDEEHRQIPFNEGRLKARQVKKAHKRETKRRSGKKNNYRKPPQRKKGPATSEEVHQDVRGSDKTGTDTTTLKGKYTESLTFSTPNCIYADYGKLGKPTLHRTILQI